MLPNNHNLKYIDIQEGLHFGEMDIVGHIIEREDKDIYAWIEMTGKLKR